MHRGGKAAPVQFPAAGREFTAHSRRRSEGRVSRISSHAPKAENIDFNRPSHAGASFVSLAPIFLSQSAHSAAPPFKIEPTSPVFNFVLPKELRNASASCVHTIRERGSPYSDPLSLMVLMPFLSEVPLEHCCLHILFLLSEGFASHQAIKRWTEPQTAAPAGMLPGTLP